MHPFVLSVSTRSISLAFSSLRGSSTNLDSRSRSNSGSSKSGFEFLLSYDSIHFYKSSLAMSAMKFSSSAVPFRAVTHLSGLNLAPSPEASSHSSLSVSSILHHSEAE